MITWHRYGTRGAFPYQSLNDVPRYFIKCSEAHPLWSIGHCVVFSRVSSMVATQKTAVCWTVAVVTLLKQFGSKMKR